MTNYLQRQKEILDKMTLMDDFFMNFVFNDQPELTKQLLIPVLNISKDIHLVQSTSQSLIENPYGKNVRLDILAKDEQGTFYDIEMQQKVSDDLSFRARYYASMLDYKFIHQDKGKAIRLSWKHLPDTYVIFFISKDYFDEGLPVYLVQRCLNDKNHTPINDGQCILFVNCSYNDTSSDIGKLIHDLHQTDPKAMFNKALADRVQYIKEDKEGGFNMSELLTQYLQDTFEEGLGIGKEQGVQEEKVNNINTVLNNYCKMNPDIKPDEAITHVSSLFGIDESVVKQLLH